jgi:hypothetical protein
MKDQANSSTKSKELQSITQADKIEGHLLSANRTKSALRRKISYFMKLISRQNAV